MKKTDSIFLNFFKQLDIASKEISTIKNNFNMKSNKIIHANQIPKPEINDSTFFPDIIKTDIGNNSTYLINYKGNIRDKRILLNFIVFDENLDKNTMEKYNLYAKKIFTWFYLYKIILFPIHALKILIFIFILLILKNYYHKTKFLH